MLRILLALLAAPLLAAALSAAVAPAAHAEGWHARTVTDDFTDEVTYVVVQESTEPVSGLGVPPALALVCEETGTIVIIIRWEDIIAGINGTKTPVLYRFDKEKAATANLIVVNDGVFFHSDGEARRFLKRMLQHQSLRARVEEYPSGYITAVFPLSGLRQHLKPFEEHCGLDLSQ